MSFFPGPVTKYYSWLQNADHGLFLINGLSADLTPMILDDLFEHKNHAKIIICPSEESAEDLYASMDPDQTLYFPGLNESPYAPVIASERDLFKRFHFLQKLIKTPNFNVVTSIEAFMMKLPPKSFFDNNQLTIEISDIISPERLAQELVDLGYQSTITVEEPGCFSKRGEIFDIFPIAGEPVRLSYFDDMIEEMHGIDITTQKTDKEITFEKIEIGVTPGILTKEQYRNTLRENLRHPSIDNRDLLEFRKMIFANLSSGQFFENYPVYIPAFFKETSILLDYFESPEIVEIDTYNVERELLAVEENLRSDYELHLKDHILPPPTELYQLGMKELLKTRPILGINEINIEQEFDEDTLSERVDLNIERATTFLSRNVMPNENKLEYFKNALQFIKRHIRYRGDLYFACSNESSKKEIKFLVDGAEFDRDILERVHFIDQKLRSGFYYGTELLLVLTDSDFFSHKTTKTKKISSKDIDLFAEQLSTLKIGDYVMHSEHGVGVYDGLQTMKVGSNESDYLVINYAEGDKIYVPVYKMNQIGKHADKTAGLKPASLRTNKFLKLRESAKESAKKLAFDLLKLQAERQTSHAFPFSEFNHLDREFAMAFPFDETPDQTRAIEEVQRAMEKPVPMDYLVCGDVGFGKTEVAMRAAFKAVNDGKQVAVLVPTTILALQHYNSFVERFKGFPVNIEFVSRFKSAKQVKEIMEKVESGAIDILVGTHKLLNSNLKFQDLGLVIVDEEQRFGVGHKEKLKLMKASVDFLTLTATPIPRTLQLAFLGLRDLSLIQTAPPRRQSIKTYLIKEDDLTIQSALNKELSRGGQVFYVHNRVQDMDEVLARLKELVPDARICVAHGQMPEKELEVKIRDFYAGKYQILLSTTIIESGIDIPNANTMIVDRADTYGLSQLHQLRGRIGRSDRKAYAYFVIPNKLLSSIAEARLKALQTYADMGSGFSIASADLEIRGAGDILGASQSGHIENVGLELYMELLKEAIFELRGEQKIIKRDIEINTPFATFIPNNYISDSPLRLKFYKRLANCDKLEVLEQIKDEMMDMFGLFPEPLTNLFSILQTRIALSGMGLKGVQVAGSLITLQFDKNILDKNKMLQDRVVETFMKRPKVYKFTPDYRVIYTHKKVVDKEELLSFAKKIAEEVVPC